MATNTLDAQRLYTIIADTMPTEGRDFTINTRRDDGNKLTVTVKPLTPVGRGFVPVLLDRLAGQMGTADVAFTSDGTASALEVETVNTIRARVERDATATLNARLLSAQKRYKETSDRIRQEDKERGDRVLTSEEEERRAHDSGVVQAADAQQRQLQYMLAHMPEAREQIGAASRAAAETDLKAGKDWTTDQNAPLTSMFDRTDATDKLRKLEMYAQQLAAHMFMADSIKVDAAAVGKQYALHK